jgi:hypothetical protein
VADRITAYQAGVQERVQAAERERAVAVAKAIEERRRRKVQLALAASVLALITLGGLSTTYYLQQQQARAAAGQRVIDQVATLQKQAVAHPQDNQRWEVAQAAVEQADPASNPNTRAQLLALQKEIRAGLDAARRDKTLLDRVARSARPRPTTRMARSPTTAMPTPSARPGSIWRPCRRPRRRPRSGRARRRWCWA